LTFFKHKTRHVKVSNFWLIAIKSWNPAWLPFADYIIFLFDTSRDQTALLIFIARGTIKQ